MQPKTRRLEVFAVGPDWAQLTWDRLPTGSARIDHPGGTTSIESDGGPGAVTIESLPVDDLFHIAVRPQGSQAVTLKVATLARPPGAELFRFATLSDLHLGTWYFGFHRGLSERNPAEPHPIRCTRAAISESLAWGAERMVVKGDIVHWSRPHSWASANELFGDLPVPVDMVCGNHDVSAKGTVDPFAEARRYGLALHQGVEAVDVPGLRLVMFDSSVNEIDIGRWNHLREPVCDALAEAGSPAMLLVHHQPQEHVVPSYLPRGIPASAASKFIRTARRANPDLFGTSGHTHRHRRRTVAGVDWSEVGSPKDYPGTWAGYTVYEGGFVQTVRRVEQPDCIRWTTFTRRAALGAWGRWSPGSLEDRCFTKTW